MRPVLSAAEFLSVYSHRHSELSLGVDQADGVFHFHNTRRRHGSLKMLTPAEYNGNTPQQPPSDSNLPCSLSQGRISMFTFPGEDQGVIERGEFYVFSLL